MHLPIFKFSDLMPITHWALVMASYFLSKVFMKEAFMKGQKYLSRSEKILYSIFILVPAIVSSCIISLLISDNWVNWGVYIAVIIPSIVGCYVCVNISSPRSTYASNNDSGGRY